MADGNGSGIFSIRAILENTDHLANWATSVVVAGNFAILVGLKDKLTGAAIALSFWAAVSLAMIGWPTLLEYGYGGFGIGVAFGLLCGVAGMLLLMTLIGIVRRVYDRRAAIADELLRRRGVGTVSSKEDE